MLLLRAAQLLTQYYQDTLARWQSIQGELRKSFAGMDDAAFERDKPATKFILTWMRDLKGLHDNFGKLIRRQKRPPIADDFTAAMAFCLDQFLGAWGYSESVQTEKTTGAVRGAT